MSTSNSTPSGAGSETELQPSLPYDYYQNAPADAEGYEKAEDQALEAETAKIIAQKWGRTLHKRPKFDPIDYHASKDGYVTSFLEVKCRHVPSTKYPTVFLNVRKYLALMEVTRYLRLPSVFVVRYDDCIKYIRTEFIDPRRIRIGGCREIVKSHFDQEPMIEVPVSQMELLCSEDEFLKTW